MTLRLTTPNHQSHPIVNSGVAHAVADLLTQSLSVCFANRGTSVQSRFVSFVTIQDLIGSDEARAASTGGITSEE